MTEHGTDRDDGSLEFITEGDCPECGRVRYELIGGDGGADDPVVGLACVWCDHIAYFDGYGPDGPVES